MFQIFSVAKFLAKGSVIIVSSHRKVILLLLIEDTFQTAEIRSVGFVHILFSSLSIISQLSWTY